MNIVTIILYELKMMLRNRVNMIVLLVMPVAMIALMGYAMKPFLNTGINGAEKLPESYADSGKIDIGRDFDASISAAAAKYGLSEKELDDIRGRLENDTADGFVDVETVNGPEERTINSFQFFGAGMLIFFLLTCGMGLGADILSERSDRVFFRIISFPVTHNQYLAGKAAANALIGLFQAATVILLTSLLFGVDWGGNYPGLFLVVMEVMLVTSGIAIIFSNILNSSKALTTLLIVLYWMMTFASGSFTPMPAFEAVSPYMVNRWAFEVLTGFMTGKGLAEVSNYLLLLLAVGLAFWAAGVMLYKRRVSNE